MSGGPNETVQSWGRRKWVIQVPVQMAFVPGRAWILFAHRDHVKRLHRGTIRRHLAIVSRKWERRIASRIRRSRSLKGSRPGRRIELRETIKRPVGIAIRRPIFSKGSKVVIKTTILLRKDNNVVHFRDIALLIRRGVGSDASAASQEY